MSHFHNGLVLLNFQATPKAIDDLPALPQAFFARPAEQVAPDLIGCLLVKHQPSGELLWGVIVEMEAYSQDDPACHGYRGRSRSNETLFGEPGRFYVYVSYGIHHCVKVGRIKGAGESLHAKWVEVTDADITSSGRPLVKHCRRMLRFNAEQLWQNLIRQGWKRVSPQW
jgi:DNA-3-methyladenine glycosylase